ncbi:MAG: protein TolR [Janthinobacterium lividum]
MAGSMRSSMRGGRGRRVMSDINVVPYIDVMLVLLVIFMVTAPLVTPAVVDLPTVGGTSAAQQTPPVIVNVRADGTMSVRYKDEGGAAQELPMTLTDLTTFLQQRQQAAPDQPVVIAGDKAVRYEKVMNVMSELKTQGIKRVGLLVKSQ